MSENSTEKNSFGNSPTTYAGVFATILAALIRMLCPDSYVQDALTISSAISPALGVWVFGILNKKKKTDAQIAFTNDIKERMKFLDSQINDNCYSEKQKKEFIEEKAKLAKELVNYNRTVE
ncbi:hypothetical protein HS327_01978 [Glaesserella parasuis]|uniref:hypothetical protein n=1 Tax=Glaesserella parasuis TaxID=738 RepID=UPI0004DD29EC|nr:hypothetical protein [Glaesserella parasuis]KEZ17241.1 hypothetical protein HS327_01978 [Glaesserella parasuis]